MSIKTRTQYQDNDGGWHNEKEEAIQRNKELSAIEAFNPSEGDYGYIDFGENGLQGLCLIESRYNQGYSWVALMITGSKAGKQYDIGNSIKVNMTVYPKSEYKITINKLSKK